MGHRFAEPGFETGLEEGILPQVGCETGRHDAYSLAHRMGGIAGDFCQKVFKRENERIRCAVIKTNEAPDPPCPFPDLRANEVPLFFEEPNALGGEGVEEGLVTPLPDKTFENRSEKGGKPASVRRFPGPVANKLRHILLFEGLEQAWDESGQA